MVLCSIPWIWALHNKYGIWTTSTSGSLNMSWYLVGHPYWKEGIGALLPPAYPDSPYYWEDPWFVNGVTPHFWNSWHLFGLQFLRIGLNIWKFIVSSLQLSVFFIVIVGHVKWKLFWKRDVSESIQNRMIMVSFFLFILGYLPINFEARYLWYMVPLGMVIGGCYEQGMRQSGLKNIVPYLFAVSFLIYPLWQMVKMWDEGKQEYAVASMLKQRGINGSFISDTRPGGQTQRIARLAYFSGNAFFVKPIVDSPWNDDPSKYHVRYWIVTEHTDDRKGETGRRTPNDTNRRAFPCVLHFNGYSDLGLTNYGRVLVFRIDSLINREKQD